MAGEKEPDGLELLLQPLGRRPWLAGGKYERGAGRIAEGEFQRAAGRHVVAPLRLAEYRVDRREGAGAVRLERVEGAGGGQAFHHALVHGARIDAAGEAGGITERLCGAAPPRRAPRPPAP